jgi:hypothetical protein
MAALKAAALRLTFESVSVCLSRTNPHARIFARPWGCYVQCNDAPWGLTVMRTTLLNLFAILILATGAFAQDDKPLGDIARDARAAKSSAPKSAKVVTDDDVPGGRKQAGLAVGKLTPAKQVFCDQLRARKDTAAEQGCALLGIDMGEQYEDLIARYYELAKGLCGANGGRGLPNYEPKDAAHAAQWRELSALGAKYGVMWEAEKKSTNTASAPYATLQQEYQSEIAKNVPDIRNPDAIAANPAEKERFREIEDKYKPLLEEAEQPIQQERLRMMRYGLDMALMQDVCGDN